jgi:pilus assembly protein CpaB
MNNRGFTISIVIAVLAVLMVNSYVTSTEEQYKSQFGEEINVVVAKVDIKELQMLDDTNLDEQTIPKKFQQPGAARSKEQVKGALSLGPIKTGEQITVTRVTKLGARTGLSQAITKGKRAITLRVGDDSGVAKLIKPGDFVDVMATIDTMGGKKQGYKVKTILEGVKVIAVGKMVENTLPGIFEKDPNKETARTQVNLAEYSNYANITFEVEALQAQELAFAQNVFGGIYVILRNRDDATRRNNLPTTWDDFNKDGQGIPVNGKQ